MARSKVKKSRPSRKLPKLPPLPPGEHAIDAVLDHDVRTHHRQSYQILQALARWCEQAPGRSFRLERAPDGWRARLDERRDSTGSTALDALSQVAVVASFETPTTDEVTLP